MEREIDLRMVEHCNRKANAMRYSANARRRMSKATRLVNFLKKLAEHTTEFIREYAPQILTLLLVFASVVMLGYGFVKEPSEPRYAIASEVQANGNHYIYVTEKPCTVTEVTDTKVYVEYKGNEYSFYAYKTQFKVGDEITCRFTDDMKIYDTTERR